MGDVERLGDDGGHAVGDVGAGEEGKGLPVFPEKNEGKGKEKTGSWVID